MSVPTDNPSEISGAPPGEQDRELRELLQRCRVPPPPPQTFERAVAHAVREREHARRHGRSRVRWLATGFGAAVAAGLVALVVGGLVERSGLPGAADGSSTVPVVSMSLYEPETVRLVFAAEMALEDASMTVLLPPGIELEGFPGQREVRWDTSLAAGRNLLPLTLVATAPAGGELLARLEHESRDRTFRLRIEIG